MPIPMKATLNFVSSPRPSISPSSSHPPGPYPRTEAHAARRETPVQISWSITTGCSRLAERRKSGLVSTQNAASALGHPASSQLSRDEGRQDQHRAAEERREEADGRERVAQQGSGDLGHDGDGWRKVHAPETEVPTHAEVEQLVPVKSVRRAQVDRRCAGRP